MRTANSISNKIIKDGILLETIKSTEAQKEYMHYCYNNKFYRITKYLSDVILTVSIPKAYLSELALYRLNH